MKIKRVKHKVCGTLAFLSFMWLVAVAGNSDLGLEPDLGALCLKVLAGFVVFASSLKIGGFIK